MFGYMDESGAPGTARNTNDYLLVSLVLFASREAADKCSRAIDHLRQKMKLPENYEFHFSRNANWSREALLSLITNLDFRFITVAIKKDGFRRTASYARIATLLAREIAAHSTTINIEMDSNPILQKELLGQAKANQLKITLKAKRSKNHNLLQLADYVAALSLRKIKTRKEATKTLRSLVEKQLSFLEIAE